MGRFEINRDRIREKEEALFDCVKRSFLRRNSIEVGSEPQKFGQLDVYFVYKKGGKKTGVEVKAYFTILGAEGSKPFGQALLCKARTDVEKMYVAFPMSECKDDNDALVENVMKRFGKIWKKLGLEGEIENLSLKEINKQIYKKAYSNIGIGLLGIIGHVVENDKFQVDRVEKLYSA